ncbi:MAG: hypothetical protein KKG75_03740 [Nanoarchaeota archaeon]|nr:hypothetical protein [Nanoarchaeota archaeon]
MNIEILNPYVMKIIITARKQDSMNSIAKRIKLSYGWTHKWCRQLINLEVFKEYKSKLILNETNKFYQNTLNYIKTNFSKDINFYYSVLDLFGIQYCFTGTDSVFIWTKGGYNIARYKDHYPIFIKVKKDHLNILQYHCKKLNLKINAKTGISYHIEISDDFKISWLNNVPVDSLNTTIKFMKKNIYNFQPALEMIKEMYNKKINTIYRETNYV